jgi:hypothetical protein
VQAASSNVRDGPAATRVAPQTEVGARATVMGARVTVKPAQATAVGARVSVIAVQVHVIGARVGVIAVQVTVIGARVTVDRAQATVVAARMSAMAAQASANGEQARRVVSARSVAAGPMPSDQDAARARVRLRPGSPDTTGRDNQGAASFRQIVIVTSDGRRTRRAADGRGPMRPLLPIASSGRTCLTASLLTS